jgi:peptidyl-prolyl cis-trans isomerase A (cyclophilin A)
LVDCDTTKGPVALVIEPSWAPVGAARFLELVDAGFFTDVALFRCVDNFLCQFGYKKGADWPSIADDDMSRAHKPFKRGYVSFAGNGPRSRSQHLFVTLGRDVRSLGREPWETPIGYVEDASMEQVVAKWETKYGDFMPPGKGPDPGRIDRAGNAYLKKDFADLDYWLGCKRRAAAGQTPPVSSSGALAAGETGGVAAGVDANVFTLELQPKLGKVVIRVDQAAAPLGAQRLLDMLSSGYLNGARFFRVWRLCGKDVCGLTSGAGGKRRWCRASWCSSGCPPTRARPSRTRASRTTR